MTVLGVALLLGPILLPLGAGCAASGQMGGDGGVDMDGASNQNGNANLNQNVNGNGNGGGDTVYRVREGIERFLITDINNPAASAKAQSEVFILWDNVSTQVAKFNHIPGGSNVLYMDGHVEFLKYPTKSPVNEAMARLMGLFSS